MSLYETLKAAKIGAASDVFTTLRGRQAPFAKGGSYTEKELTDTPPLSFGSNGDNLTDWIIEGNCGKNLFNKDILADNYQLDRTTGLPVQNNNRCATLQPIDVSNYNSVTISFESDSTTKAMYSIFNGETLLARTTELTSGSTVNTANATAIYFSFYNSVSTVTAVTTDDITNIMLNSGSTALEYEPYAAVGNYDEDSGKYKIPITCGGTTTNISADAPIGVGQSISMTDTSISIPTVSGSNTLSVGTTVQPSKVYIKYKE